MSGPSSPDPRIGTILDGRYRILSCLATGGMGTVYRGERLQLNRAVAIKFLQLGGEMEADRIRRFEHEARAMSRLSHPHCVSVIDFGVAGGPYIVMEMVYGQTLRDLLSQGRLEVRRTINIIQQILAGLAHAHDHSIVHRDIKPDNVTLGQVTGKGDHIYLLDFGLAKLRDLTSPADQSQTHILAGTPAYMSPEQASARSVDGRSDLYSTGVLLFELLTGEKPFQHQDTAELIRLQREASPPDPRSRLGKGTISDELAEAVLKALRKAPEERFQSAADFAAALSATPEARGLIRAGGKPPEEPATAKKGPVVEEQAAPEEQPASESDTVADVPSARLHDDARPGPSRRWQRRALLLMLVGGAVSAVWIFQQRQTGQHDGEASTHDRGPRRPAADAAPVLPSSAIGGPRADANRPARDARPWPDALARARDAGLDRVSADAEPTAEAELDEGDLDPDPGAAAESGSRPAQSITPTERAARPRRRPRPTPFVDVRQLIQAGKPDAAIRRLQKIRPVYSRNGYFWYLLGLAYFDKHFWSDAIEAYTSAIKIESNYRKRPAISKDLIAALASDRTAGKASRLLLRIGSAAVPHLRAAAKSDRNPRVRAQAAALARRIK